jgi:hypothetical protein
MDLDELSAAGFQPPDAGRKVVDRSAAATREAAPAARPHGISVQARPLEWTRHFAVASRADSQQIGDVLARRNREERVIALPAARGSQRRRIASSSAAGKSAMTSSAMNLSSGCSRSTVTGLGGVCLKFKLPGGRRIRPASKHIGSAASASTSRALASSARRGESGAASGQYAWQFGPEPDATTSAGWGRKRRDRSAGCWPSHSAQSVQTAPTASFVPARRVPRAHIDVCARTAAPDGVDDVLSGTHRVELGTRAGALQRGNGSR